MNLLQCLRDPSKVPSRQDLAFAQDLMSRLLANSVVLEESESIIDSPELEMEKELTMQDELYQAIDSAYIMPKTSDEFSKIKSEFVLLRNTGKRTENLKSLYEALLTIKPTSTDVKRVISATIIKCLTVLKPFAAEEIGFFCLNFLLKVRNKITNSVK